MAVRERSPVAGAVPSGVVLVDLALHPLLVGAGALALRRSHWPPPSGAATVGVVKATRIGAVGAGLVVLGVGCLSEDATPIGEIDPPAVTSTVPADGIPHQLEPTEQMRELAERQCLDDPQLEQGEVSAVAPADPDVTLAQVVVDCAEVRG
jgi:hypothetical protein